MVQEAPDSPKESPEIKMQALEPLRGVFEDQSETGQGSLIKKNFKWAKNKDGETRAEKPENWRMKIASLTRSLIRAIGGLSF